MVHCISWPDDITGGSAIPFAVSSRVSWRKRAARMHACSAALVGTSQRTGTISTRRCRRWVDVITKLMRSRTATHARPHAHPRGHARTRSQVGVIPRAISEIFATVASRKSQARLAVPVTSIDPWSTLDTPFLSTLSTRLPFVPPGSSPVRWDAREECFLGGSVPAIPQHPVAALPQYPY